MNKQDVVDAYENERLDELILDLVGESGSVGLTGVKCFEAWMGMDCEEGSFFRELILSIALASSNQK